jgi:hypothetical protein
MGLGCFLMVPGFFGGGMLGVTVAWIVTGLTRCTAPAELPACNMWPYLAIGAVAGAIVLPSIVLWRVGRRARPENSERS